MSRKPGFSAITISTLALGMGAAASVFAVLDAVLLRPLPYAEPDRLVWLHEVRPDGFDFAVSQANFLDWRERNRVFTDIAAIDAFPAHVNLTGGAEAMRVPGHRVSQAFFEVLGVDAAIGRTLVADDDRPGAEPVVVLGDAIWRRAFAADRTVVGKVVRIDDEPHTVVGVMPPGFTLHQPQAGSPELWRQGALPPENNTVRAARSLGAVARLRPGVGVAAAQAELDAIAEELAQAHPQANRMNDQAWRPSVTPLHDRLVAERTRATLIVLSGAVALLLLISWINVTNLLLAQTAARSREVAVRKALGAGRWRIARQFLTHAFVLSGAGGLLALALTRLLIPGLLAAAPGMGAGLGPDAGFIPLLARTSVSTWVAVMTVVTAIVTAGICGLAPALRAAWRPAGAGLKTASMKHARLGSTGSLLAAVEVSLALVLLIGVGLLVETLVHISRLPAGFEAEGVDLVRVQMTPDRYSVPVEGAAPGTRSLTAEYHALVLDIVRQISALPGVHAAGAANILPLQSSLTGASFHVEGLEREGTRVAQGVPVHGSMRPVLVTPGYFGAVGTRIVAGRGFTGADDVSSIPTVIVDRYVIDFFDLPDPLGRALRVGEGGSGWREVEVVGIAESRLPNFDNQVLSGDRPRTPVAYLPFAHRAPHHLRWALPQYLTVNFVARRDPDGRSVVDAMRRIVRRADPDTPITYADQMVDYIAASQGDRRFPMLLIGILALVSSLLALSGVYGVLSFGVHQRTHEIGVRMALGARADEVVRMIVREGVQVALLGALAGIAIAMGTTRLLSGWLFGVSPTDPLLLAGLAAATVTVASLAAWVPARRASRVDPVGSLGVE
jgi:putative ABC transport system permease protein